MLFKLSKDPVSTKSGEKIYPLLPLRDMVVFPYMVAPLFVGREKSINAVEYALEHEKDLFLTAQKEAKTNDPTQNDLCEVGILGSILQLLKLPDGTVKLLVEGKKRAKIKRLIPDEQFFSVSLDDVEEFRDVTVEMYALMRGVNKAFENYVGLNKKIPHEMISAVLSIEDPGRLSDTIASHVNLKLEDKQDILETLDPAERLEKLYGLIESEVEILQIEKKIKGRVRKQMEKTQKEYYLSEQMRAIQKEMGEKDEFKTELAELKENIKKKKMSKEAKAKAEKEFKKLKMMAPMSAEGTVVRNYIDWLISLPWFDRSEDKLDIDEAEKILDEDHYGLKKVKERIIEHLAVSSLVDKMKGPILCFVGPPGVGKTSLAKSIARASARKFVRCSLGGVRDEAEIRGHRRTYIGSMPGKIIQSIKKAGSNNPVFLLDEVDKMSADFRGDPASALLEVLDPEQNHAFNDHYLDVDYDLSEVMFITTANTLYSIPLPLQDRMEIIRIAGYTELEKLGIARKFLVPKQKAAHGLADKNISFSMHAILGIVSRYTRESGVRNLEREIASICRKVAREIVKRGKDTKIRVQSSSLQKYLGVPKYRYGKIEEKEAVGLATGLAWTEQGGELLVTEVAVMPGKGKLTVTGKLGDVMQESAQAAMSYVRSRAERLNLKKDFYQNVDIHIHVPEGAIPKDGPSAGITMATCITSALTKKAVRKDIAMTGEITLRGRILPIGGLKEKVLAAHRGGIKTILIPDENEKDIQEIPHKILNTVDIVMVQHMDEVLKTALIIEDPKNFMREKEDEEIPREFYEEEQIQEAPTHSIN